MLLKEPHTIIRKGRIEERGQGGGTAVHQYILSPFSMTKMIDFTVSQVGRADPSSQAPSQIA